MTVACTAVLMEEVERSRHGFAVEKVERGIKNDTQILTLQTLWIVVSFTGPHFPFEVSLRHERGTEKESHWIQGMELRRED